MLFKECAEHFAIEEAIKYHDYLDTKNEILHRPSINLNQLFFAILHHMGLQMHFDNESQPEQMHHYLNEKQHKLRISASILHQYAKTQRIEKYFKVFGKVEKPFGEPKHSYPLFKFAAKSKTFQLRNTPYKDLVERIQGSVREQRIEEALQYA